MAGSSSAIIKNKFDDYKSCANEAIHFKLVRNAEDVKDKGREFSPDMTHQIFGDAESIFGYRDLVVDVYYSAARLSSYVTMKHGGKVDEANEDGLVADTVLPSILKEMGSGVYTNLDDFITSLDKEHTFKPFGRLLHSYKVISKENSEHNFEIYETTIEEKGFRDYHSRLQTFILYYIDAASFIDVDDEKWSFYVTYEKSKTSSGQNIYCIVGYMTVYNYYAYPTKIRPRVSQMLTLPPYQCQGHGVQLLQAFYNNTCSRSDVLDITVEDPSENFQRMRDFVDSRNCRALGQYQKEELLKGFSEDKAKEARDKLKLCRRQARRVYEILRLKATDGDTETFTQYRLDVKRRLNAPFQKNGRDLEKLNRELKPNEISQTLNVLTTEQRMEYLEKAFQEEVDAYRHILERLVVYG